MRDNNSVGFKLFSLAVFVLFAAPKINIKLGSIPVYLIDVLLIATLYYAHRLPLSVKFNPFKGLVHLFVILVIINEIFNGILIGTLLQPVYMVVRMTLAVSMVYLVPKFCFNRKQILQIIRFASLGGLITAALLVLSSLPITRSMSLSVLGNPYLEPNALSVSRHLMEQGGVGIRGSSLVGVSILSGTYLNVIWPLSYLLRDSYEHKALKKHLLSIAILLIFFGVIVTYSRGVLLGSLLIIIMIFIQRNSRYRGLLISMVILGSSIIGYIGVDSRFFYFDRIAERTEAILDNPYEDERESERLLAYVQPWAHLLDNPSYLLIGEGWARHKVPGVKAIEGNEVRGERADHALLAAAYYSYGIFGAIVLLYFYFYTFKHTARMQRASRAKSSFAYQLSKTLFLVLLGMSTWIAFDHGAISSPRGAMLMFFVFGLVASLRSILESEYNNHC